MISRISKLEVLAEIGIDFAYPTRIEVSMPSKMQKRNLICFSEASRQKISLIANFQHLERNRLMWGTDQKLMKANILMAPQSVNYQVLMKMGGGKPKA